MDTLDATLLSDRLIGTRPPQPDTPTIAEGPFAVEHNGVTGFGARLMQVPDLVFFRDGSRVIQIDSQYTVEVEGDTVTFFSEKYDSKIVLRPIVLEDASVFPDMEISLLPSLEQIVYDGIINNGLTGGEDTSSSSPVGGDPLTAAVPVLPDSLDGASYGVTVDEDDSTVLAVVLSTPDGVFLREDNSWQGVDPDLPEEDYPQFYNATWLDATVDVVPAYDEKSSEGIVTKNDLSTFLAE